MQIEVKKKHCDRFNKFDLRSRLIVILSNVFNVFDILKFLSFKYYKY